MKKIGFLLNRKLCDKYLYTLIETLSNCPELSVVVFVAPASVEKRSQINGLVTYQHAPTTIAKIVIGSEYLLLKCFKKDGAHRQPKDISQLTGIHVESINSSVTDPDSPPRYRLDDSVQAQIEGHKLDLLFGSNLCENLLSVGRSAADGVIYCEVGTNSGLFPAHQEVLEQQPGTSSQITLSPPDGNLRVLQRFETPTSASFTLNQIRVFSALLSKLSRLLTQYSATDSLTPQPPHLLNYDHIGREKRKPYSGYQYSKCLVANLWKAKKVISRTEHFGIAYSNISWPQFQPKDAIQISNPENHFFADPFLYTRDGETVCFVEDYSERAQKGSITAIQILSDNDYKVLGEIIEEPFHLSFPYVFEYQNDLYMMPESAQDNSIRIYKCMEFPLKWKFHKKIMENCFTVDSMMFQHSGKWWLFTNMATDFNYECNTSLHAFYADSPLSNDWSAHQLNPLLISTQGGRNAGILTDGPGLPIRIKQHLGFLEYGVRFSGSRILELSPTNYREQECFVVHPDFDANITGCHHMHSHGEYTVCDYKFLQP